MESVTFKPGDEVVSRTCPDDVFGVVKAHLLKCTKSGHNNWTDSGCLVLEDRDTHYFPSAFELKKKKKKDDTKKDTNPKDAVGTGKVPFSTVPASVIGELGLAMLEGARKYGRSNYRVAGVRGSVYYDAAFRHLSAWWEGQDLDPDSGISHITKAMACLAVLRDSQMFGNWVDDRPPKVPNQDWMVEMNAKAKAIVEKYPNPVPAFTALGGE